MSKLEVYVPAKVAQGVDLAFARLGEPKVIMQVKISGLGGRKFDKNRLLLMYLDGEVQIDFCDTKSISELMSRLDSNSTPGFSFEDQDASGVVWHGIPEEGTGVIGKILDSKELSIGIYFDDYTFEVFEMPQDELRNLKLKISDDIIC